MYPVARSALSRSVGLRRTISPLPNWRLGIKETIPRSARCRSTKAQFGQQQKETPGYSSSTDQVLKGMATLLSPQFIPAIPTTFQSTETNLQQQLQAQKPQHVHSPTAPAPFSFSPSSLSLPDSPWPQPPSSPPQGTSYLRPPMQKPSQANTSHRPRLRLRK